MNHRQPAESIDWLAQVIKRLPSDDHVLRGTPGYNQYTTQKDHWLGWLDPAAGTGTYRRQSHANRDARDVYNRIVEPRLLVWLISAAAVDPDLIRRAVHEAEVRSSLASKSAAIRRHVPWHVVAEALRRIDSG